MIALIKDAWSPETTDTWDPKNPALGQCAVTALIVQDLVGGGLIRCMNFGISHYFNRVGDAEIDLTREQFVTWHPSDFSVGDRQYMLSFPDTKRRYRALWENLAYSADFMAMEGSWR